MENVLLLMKKRRSGKTAQWTKIFDDFALESHYGMDAAYYDGYLYYSGTAKSKYATSLKSLARFSLTDFKQTFQYYSVMATSNHAMVMSGGLAYIHLGDNGPSYPGRNWWWKINPALWNSSSPEYYSDTPMQSILNGRMIDAGDGKLLSFTASTYGWVQELNKATNTFSYLAGGSKYVNMYPRGGVAMYNGAILAYGRGSNPALLNDTVAIYNRNDLAVLENRGIAPIPPRINSTNFARLNGKFYLYGGTANTAGTIFHNDLWQFDPVTNVWTEIAVAPQIAQGMSKAALVSDGNALYLIGGQLAGQYKSSYDIWKIEF